MMGTVVIFFFACLLPFKVFDDDDDVCGDGDGVNILIIIAIPTIIIILREGVM